MKNFFKNEDGMWNERRVGVARFILFTILIIANASINYLYADQGDVPMEAAFLIIVATIALGVSAWKLLISERGGFLYFPNTIHVLAWVVIVPAIIIISSAIITEASPTYEHASGDFMSHLGPEIGMMLFSFVVLIPYWIAVTIHFIIKQVAITIQTRKS